MWIQQFLHFARYSHLCLDIMYNIVDVCFCLFCFFSSFFNVRVIYFNIETLDTDVVSQIDLTVSVFQEGDLHLHICSTCSFSLIACDVILVFSSIIFYHSMLYQGHAHPHAQYCLSIYVRTHMDTILSIDTDVTLTITSNLSPYFNPNKT